MVSDWRNSLIDHKGSMTFRGEFGRLIREIEVLHFQPDPVSNLELVDRSLFHRPVKRFFRLLPSPRGNLDPLFRSLVL